MSNQIVIKKRSTGKFEISNSKGDSTPLTFINNQDVKKLTFTDLEESSYKFQCCIGIINYPPPHKPNIPYVIKIRTLENRFTKGVHKSNQKQNFDIPFLYKEDLILDFDSMDEELPVHYHILLGIERITVDFNNSVNGNFTDVKFAIQFIKNNDTRFLEQPESNLVVDSINNQHSYLRLDYDLNEPSPIDDNIFNFTIKTLKVGQLISFIISEPNKTYVSQSHNGEVISNGHHSVFNFLIEKK